MKDNKELYIIICFIAVIVCIANMALSKENERLEEENKKLKVQAWNLYYELDEIKQGRSRE